MDRVRMEEIDQLNFWISYFGCCFPNSYDEKEDTSVSDLMYELFTEEVGDWWESFTGYYEGALDESDGYLDSPTTLIEFIAQDKVLKIEFHPGDILYFLNEEQLGSTGPHWILKTIPYQELERLLALENGRQLFLLLLPLARVKTEEKASACKEIKAQLSNYFTEDLCEKVSRCILTGLMESDGNGSEKEVRLT